MVSSTRWEMRSALRSSPLMLPEEVGFHSTTLLPSSVRGRFSTSTAWPGAQLPMLRFTGVTQKPAVTEPSASVIAL